MALLSWRYVGMMMITMKVMNSKWLVVVRGLGDSDCLGLVFVMEVEGDTLGLWWVGIVAEMVDSSVGGWGNLWYIDLDWRVDLDKRIGGIMKVVISYTSGMNLIVGNLCNVFKI